jgi:ribosomal protein S18 acetylase RimI-like enzyme
MELTVTRARDVIALDGSAAAMANIVAVIRHSSLRRAPAGAAVDEPGITGVLSGTAPILWAHHGANPARLAQLVEAAPELDEVYVDGRCPAAANLLLASGEWELREVMDQQVFRPAEAAMPVAGEPCTIDAAGPADMHIVRRALATAYQLPIHTIEAAYPDDFFVKAAPVRLFVGRSESGEVIGTIAHRQQGDAAMIFALSVRSDYRRRQVGSALLATAMRSAADDRATMLHGLTCDATRRLAGRQGFERVGSWLHLLRQPSTGGAPTR